ncbi:TPA: hypothetical protein ACHGQV_006627, partial [Pseudomonas aeruginosa]
MASKKSPPALLTSPVTVVLDGALLDALNQCRQAYYAREVAVMAANLSLEESERLFRDADAAAIALALILKGHVSRLLDEP